MIPMCKRKGNRRECGSYRGIYMMSVVGKLYGRIVIERMRGLTEELVVEEQGCFRKGRGCIDQIFAVRCLCEKFREKGREVYLGFMDLEKTYDKVYREELWDILGKYGLGGKLLDAIKSFYGNSRACVKMDGRKGNFFEVKVGLREGCGMSPWQFNVYMDSVVKEV